MRADLHPWSLHHLLHGPPNLGHLLELCEENYRTLLCLVPELTRCQGQARSTLALGVDLHLEVLEQTPYTTLLHLTYHFAHGDGTWPDPDATLRAYHDAAQVEVLELCQTVLAQGPHLTSLRQKWRANLFIAKWLAYCLAQGHCFTATPHPGACSGPLLNRPLGKTMV